MHNSQSTDELYKTNAAHFITNLTEFCEFCLHKILKQDYRAINFTSASYHTTVAIGLI